MAVVHRLKRPQPPPTGKRRIALFCAALAPLVLQVSDCGAAASRQHVRKFRQPDVRIAPRTAARIEPDESAEPGRRSAPDDLYLRRGYGTGGLVFGLGQGGTAQAGACADLAFARPGKCGPGGGYGIYGNGLGYGFGF